MCPLNLELGTKPLGNESAGNNNGNSDEIFGLLGGNMHTPMDEDSGWVNFDCSARGAYINTGTFIDKSRVTFETSSSVIFTITPFSIITKTKLGFGSQALACSREK